MIEHKVVSQCISSDYCKGWNDAVNKIVRCKDCKHFRYVCEDIGDCKAPVFAIPAIESYPIMDRNDFCSLGERKDNGN